MAFKYYFHFYKIDTSFFFNIHVLQCFNMDIPNLLRKLTSMTKRRLHMDAAGHVSVSGITEKSGSVLFEIL